MSSTYNITPTDFKVRMQSIACCLASKGLSIANGLQIGSYCEEDIKRFEVAHAMFDLLKTNYSVVDDNTYPYIEYTSAFTAGNIWTWLHNGTHYATIVIAVGDNAWTIEVTGFTFEEIIDACKSELNCDSFNIEYDSDTTTLTITGCADWSELDATITFNPTEGGGIQFISSTFSEYVEGEDLDETNCTTTDQVNQRFEWFQSYCNICFDADYGAYEQSKLIPTDE